MRYFGQVLDINPGVINISTHRTNNQNFVYSFSLHQCGITRTHSKRESVCIPVHRVSIAAPACKTVLPRATCLCVEKCCRDYHFEIYSNEIRPCSRKTWALAHERILYQQFQMKAKQVCVTRKHTIIEKKSRMNFDFTVQINRHLHSTVRCLWRRTQFFGLAPPVSIATKLEYSALTMWME